VADYCRDRPDDGDVLAIVTPLIIEPDQAVEESVTATPGQDGFVYLLKSGRHYKNRGISPEQESAAARGGRTAQAA
jgi:hypothetical protein